VLFRPRLCGDLLGVWMVGPGILRARVLWAAWLPALLIDGRDSEIGTCGRFGETRNARFLRAGRVAVVVELAFALLDP
jgi:hypothetical protein